MIDRIELKGMLPEVFADLRDSEVICRSEVWLRDVTFEKPADYLIYAESGTGKSSLCSYIYGARKDYSGTLLFDGKDVRGFDARRWSELRCRSLAYLPQQLSLFPELTAFENIEIKNRLTSHYSRREIMQMLERLEVAEKADTPARFLSIGQQQRVAIVRSLCQPFDFLLLDEPVSHLDARNNGIVAELITSECDRRGASIIATSVGNHLNINNYKTLKL